MERWLRADKPALAIPHDRFMDHERLEMLIQARHPLWSNNMVLSAKERVLQMEFFEAQEGVYTGEIPAEFGSGRPEEEAAASAARPAPEAAASAARPGAAGEEAQEDRATSTQVGEEEGEANAFGARDLCSGCFRGGERGRNLGRLERSEGISSGGTAHSTKVSSASVDATYASQGRNGVN
eukprot:s12072_g2.t1